MTKHDNQTFRRQDSGACQSSPSTNPWGRGGGEVLSLSPVPHKLVRVLRFRDLVYIDRAGKCALGNYRTTTLMMNQ